MRGLIRDASFIKWFYFGMHIKRWLLLLLLGVAIMGLGFGYFLREVYVQYTFPGFVYYMTLQFFPRVVRGVLFVCAGLALLGFAVWKLNTSLLSAFLTPERNESIVDIISNHRYLLRGPEIAAIGETVGGESTMTEHGHLKEGLLDPPPIQANRDPIRAILQAVLIVCGPGSLMTSVLAKLLEEGMPRAIDVWAALNIYGWKVLCQ